MLHTERTDFAIFYDLTRTWIDLTVLHPRAVDSPRLPQVDEDEVVVCATGHDHVAQLLHLVAERLAVAQHLQRGKDWQAAMDASIK